MRLHAPVTWLVAEAQQLTRDAVVDRTVPRAAVARPFQLQEP